ncbi:FkbM family methyltransferase [Methylosinus sp. H3A]|uniref:FkbM family methyltransferase n=1 Tax=Methylosinus sp. H3A TaxID=2785786 RepID=UPI0018C1D708|nr:FkbM family methyltransferase [Methylosinus sp. H3A]MBG0809651.1 FkbM family methyltransferase [Methylosinus sp. H3A]
MPHYLRREPIHQDTLDALLGADTKVDFIKMDIEGAEVLAMSGAREILTRSSPIIMSEVHTSQLALVSGASWREYFVLMAGFRYRPYFITGGPAGALVDEIEDGKIYNVAFLKNQ